MIKGKKITFMLESMATDCASSQIIIYGLNCVIKNDVLGVWKDGSAVIANLEGI